MTSPTWRRMAFVPLLALCMAHTGLAAQDTAPTAHAGAATRRDPEAVAAIESMASALSAITIAIITTISRSPGRNALSSVLSNR